MIRMTARVNTRDLAIFTQELRRDLQSAVDQTALMAEAMAKEFSPVDTGALRASIYAVTSLSNNGGGAVSAASALNPDSRPMLVTDQPKPFESWVYAGARYGIFAEFGTGTTPARFMFTRTAQALQPVFVAEVTSILKRRR
jgi:hypothetical protein